ncbi:MAG TPA: hypothetical protein VHK69_15940, partial [Chitinophagaceae bacterium]|nr:hypothetical protein [Chitinophagaceae bacterium]
RRKPCRVRIWSCPAEGGPSFAPLQRHSVGQTRQPKKRGQFFLNAICAHRSDGWEKTFKFVDKDGISVDTSVHSLWNDKYFER